MFSDTELDSAVAAGALSSAAAAALRDHVAASRALPAADEEHFRLLTGFNDIFVSVALVLLLSAIGAIAIDVSPPLGGIAVAAASWGLAEFFTRIRRMALPSILLLLTFAGGVAAAPVGWLIASAPDLGERNAALVGGAIALATAGASWLHWRRFHVPVTVAAGALALAVALGAMLVSALSAAQQIVPWLSLAAGLAIFALAMRWDVSDRTRVTRRADVAFWLHLAAAPLIAHPVFTLLGVTDGGTLAGGTALLVVTLYVAFGMIALAIDRRALLVSSLAYVVFALSRLFEQAGAVDLGVALTAFVIGSALLLLSAFWHAARRSVVRMLPPAWRDRLPPVTSGNPASAAAA